MPELSALLEEDEEGDEARGTCSGDEEAESEGVAMELTGNTMHTPGAAAGAGAATSAGGAPAAGQDDTPGLASEGGLTPGRSGGEGLLARLHCRLGLAQSGAGICGQLTSSCTASRHWLCYSMTGQERPMYPWPLKFCCCHVPHSLQAPDQGAGPAALLQQQQQQARRQQQRQQPPLQQSAQHPAGARGAAARHRTRRFLALLLRLLLPARLL